MLIIELSWVLALRWRSLGELSLFDIMCSQDMGLWWSNVLYLALPPQRLRPDTGQSTKTLSATRLRRKVREKKETKKEKINK